MICENILERVGNTPLTNIISGDLDIELYAKLEYYNPTGSVKDRAASYIIKKLLDSGEIDQDTTLIESSSGNFGIALSAYCKQYGLKFLCVIDPHINPINEAIIRKLGHSVVKVAEPDASGGYLLNRIKKVNELLMDIPNSYWVNQYGNPYNSEAYYNTLGAEICKSFENIDYIFMGVSSGGTITGVSRKLKEKFPNIKVIAVDIVGSVIFGGPAQKRYIPGIGSSMVPDILKQAKIDDVVMVDEVSTIKMCHELLEKHYIFAGGSSGSVFHAVKQYFQGKKFNTKPRVLTIFADRGDRYSSTIYNEAWYSNFTQKVTAVKAI
ncbi:2,3-diaminopropionate biosynthesis protein SbnA [Pseudobacteroides cellulosolvens]|uniref:N-(2-amino-2-carboxyethyl)-L-glutamate synthase n=1 Tax=Pseudobacteroides cellulosolvens ATCC 35603 = DSM 2933 TaxID=398512 RepID=A0A0L6JL24_9FIRM|nr:2,3-diaminopropionate biosynthesis protein SbnA [Pseudobacteroides cellulosolvens]KNY26428.1 Diaminopropionate biosynthesis, SbnA [Pseudobacteroides cellulosolvens ATCC 35603 = DSM 2933]